jgi:hypothetical protein
MGIFRFSAGDFWKFRGSKRFHYPEIFPNARKAAKCGAFPNRSGELTDYLDCLAGAGGSDFDMARVVRILWLVRKGFEPFPS